MKKPRIQQDDAPGGLTHNPFAALRAKGPVEAAGKASGTTGDRDDAGGPGDGSRGEVGPAGAAASGPAGRTAGSGKVVVQREKKGRGGKTVTRLSGCGHLGQDPGELAKAMKRALGCGASVDGGDVLLQGALTERAAAWIRKQYGIDVTIGN